MDFVSVVLISHSKEIVSGLEKLLRQVQSEVPLATAGGTDEGDIGTDVFKIKHAIEGVYSEKGVVILFDLGSALINAEMAIEMLDDKANIVICDAPLVEGAFAAIIEAGCGSSLEDVKASAEGAKQLSKL